MATHSRILVWRIPWTEDTGGLESRDCKESDRTKQLTLSLSERLKSYAPSEFCFFRNTHDSLSHLLQVITQKVFKET